MAYEIVMTVLTLRNITIPLITIICLSRPTTEAQHPNHDNNGDDHDTDWRLDLNPLWERKSGLPRGTPPGHMASTPGGVCASVAALSAVSQEIRDVVDCESSTVRVWVCTARVQGGLAGK